MNDSRRLYRPLCAQGLRFSRQPHVSVLACETQRVGVYCVRLS